MIQGKLYYDQPYLKEFTAEILSCRQNEQGLWETELTQTAFYPTSGGQPHDTGSINQAKVIDVVERGHRVIHLSQANPGGPVAHCQIDWPRRFDFMQQHAGQHILSEAFLALCHARTIGFHLTETNLTIDLDVQQLTPQEIDSVEATANRIVWENHRILRHWVTPEELAELPLRKMPKVSEDIRIIDIEGYDLVPCGGTHPESTGEIGMIKIRRWERSKAVTRVEFFCGGRALADYAWKNTLVLQLANELSVKDSELQQALPRFLQQNKDTLRRLAETEEQLLRLEAEGYYQQSGQQNGVTLVKAILPAARTLADLKKLALYLAEHPHTLCLLAVAGTPPQITLARSADLPQNINLILKELNQSFGGKGGGSPVLVQGSLPADADLSAFFRQAIQLFQSYAAV
ncbi:MAG: alanyl-tRNA editing protein [Negativicutes bacterium]|nr:alanyl-tRNA editing protein [Negativicutes bacterium]